MEKTAYWPDELNNSMNHGIAVEFRAEIALGLIRHFGAIAAKFEGEDSAGRNKMILLSPSDLVERCFSISEIFIAEAERRGYVRTPSVTDEQRAAMKARIDDITFKTRFSSTVEKASD